jgi:Tfp pilus assembly protein PilN
MKKLDFLPEDYIEKKAQQRANVICLCLFLVVLAGVGCGFAITEKRQGQIDGRVEDVSQQMRKASESLKKLDVLEGKRNEMMKKAAISASLMEPVPRSLLLATTTNDLPAGVSLTEFKLVSKNVKSTQSVGSRTTRSRNKKSRRDTSAKGEDDKQTIEPEKWETTIEVIGISPTNMEVAGLIANLNKSALFASVNLIYSEEHEVQEANVRKFKLEVILDPEARASEEDVQMARKKFIQGM